MSMPQEDNYRRRKDLRPPEDWQTLTFKCIKTIPQRRKSEFQGWEWEHPRGRGDIKGSQVSRKEK